MNLALSTAATNISASGLDSVANFTGIENGAWQVFGLVALVSGILMLITGPTTSKVVGWCVVIGVIAIGIGIAQNGQALSGEGNGIVRFLFGG